MIKIGDFWVNIGSYTDLTELFLGEASKYLLLLLISILAVRLWRRLPGLSGENRRNNLLLGCLATAIALVIGYFSICHSLSRLYLYYGMKAFDSGHLGSASSLFDKSSEYWMGADAVGKEGVCLLLSGKVDDGLRLTKQANILRKGQSSTFEEFYEGLYYFYSEQPGQAIPFLEDASADPDFTWRVTKAFAVLYVDNRQYADAARLMEPFLQAEVTDEDQAYVVAALKLSAGKKDEARTLVDRFESENLMPFWKSRFDKLLAKIQNPKP